MVATAGADARPRGRRHHDNRTHAWTCRTAAMTSTSYRWWSMTHAMSCWPLGRPSPAELGSRSSARPALAAHRTRVPRRASPPIRVTIARPDHDDHAPMAAMRPDGRAHQKAGPRLLPKAAPGPVKGGSGKQDCEPETGAGRGRKSIGWEGAFCWHTSTPRTHRNMLRFNGLTRLSGTVSTETVPTFE